MITIKELLKKTDFSILIIVLILFSIGILGIYSAGYNSEINSGEYIKQIIYFAALIIPMIIVWKIDYKNFSIFAYILYGISVIALIAVLFTESLYGATSWFDFGVFSYQPSEFMKLAYIICLAKLLSEYDNISVVNKKVKFKYIYIAVLFVIPFGLILLQPDFGTAIVYFVITAFMLFVNNIKYKYIIFAVILAVILVPIVYLFFFDTYQQERIDVFLDPTLDPLGSGYNAIQAEIAVGSGMLLGTGFLEGTQTQLGYLPVKSSDFIFGVLSEEFGFLMSTLIVILFLILIIRLIKVAINTNDKFAKYIVIGITAMIFFHFVQNIGMCLGLLPITGVPLPFVSYGGSNLMTNLIAIAIVLNISARRSDRFEL